MVSDTLTEVLSKLIQKRLDKVVGTLSLQVKFQVAEIRSEDGYFKVLVHWVGLKVKVEAARYVFAIVEQEIEEEFQGLRLMILPAVPKRTGTGKRKAA
jgi:hypothetical protein